MYAAGLMPLAAAVSVPRLRPGAFEPIRPRDAYSRTFDLAGNLLLAGVAQADDWEASNGDPLMFMRRTPGAFGSLGCTGR